MYVDIVISNIFYLNKHFFFSFLFYGNAGSMLNALYNRPQGHFNGVVW